MSVLVFLIIFANFWYYFLQSSVVGQHIGTVWATHKLSINC